MKEEVDKERHFYYCSVSNENEAETEGNEKLLLQEGNNLMCIADFTKIFSVE
jgi:hypothetical protein